MLLDRDVQFGKPGGRQTVFSSEIIQRLVRQRYLRGSVVKD
jgi:hypothetical protein